MSNVATDTMWDLQVGSNMSLIPSFDMLWYLELATYLFLRMQDGTLMSPCLCLPASSVRKHQQRSTTTKSPLLPSSPLSLAPILVHSFLYSLKLAQTYDLRARTVRRLRNDVLDTKATTASCNNITTVFNNFDWTIVGRVCMNDINECRCLKRMTSPYWCCLYLTMEPDEDANTEISYTLWVLLTTFLDCCLSLSMSWLRSD